MKPPPDDNTDAKLIRVRRGKVDSIELYEVKENELEALENGAPVDLYLNLAIFFISLAVTCLTSLATATFENDLIKYAFLFSVILGFLGGGVFVIFWWRDRKSIKKIVATIRSRMLPEVVEEFNSAPSSSHPSTANDGEDLKPVG